MKRITLIFWMLIVLIAFLLNLFGLMHVMPLFITMPLLFLSILFALWTFNNRNRFKGFQKKRMW
ncbi:putative membrane protein [Anoxybacillus sp. B7M1]|jgi:hypothetical protein|uniref:Uncharacterized protein n=1 Tax=Anoxybacteroides rupiense TaxID=311460 RepID=A0ABD5IV95_9BACL|nr:MULTISPECIES: hypothetical protein [Anoxybacillus]ANB58066.1 putative membrane protein [Anoxybacillus sp. B2M1]ANB65786.1 putative membrane protein [Anoxybacillus sp. B7M1]KXG10182.1 hypothetical protein AT864_01743 [Anoxybacillus sp. P3H1B]MBB3907470.1 putative membrane protein [Anoxybacillus rupiensis]MBS2770473.1 hypothetical protein [Anoxybacillus rupiensis]